MVRPLNQTDVGLHVHVIHYVLSDVTALAGLIGLYCYSTVRRKRDQRNANHNTSMASSLRLFKSRIVLSALKQHQACMSSLPAPDRNPEIKQVKVKKGSLRDFNILQDSGIRAL